MSYGDDPVFLEVGEEVYGHENVSVVTIQVILKPGGSVNPLGVTVHRERGGMMIECQEG